MGLIIFIVIYYILLSLSLAKLFKKADVDPKKAYIPGVNMGELAKLAGRKASYSWWLLFPIVNIFIISYLLIDLVRSFGKYTFFDSFLAVVVGPVYNFFLGNDDKVKYLGPAYEQEMSYKNKLVEAKKTGNKLELNKLERNNPYGKTPIREWSEAIIFAVFAATFIRMFLLEAFMIPTGSMEGSLMTGDFLFVSKVHYGVRTPQTVAMLPLVHNRAPFGNTESYFKSPKLSYKRLPALTKVKRNDPVVFNYPEGDSVYVIPGRTWSVYDMKRGGVPPDIAQYIRSGNVDMVVRPMDKADHYIKRCVAVPGDKLEIKNRQLYVNDEEANDPKNIQFSYIVKFGNSVNSKRLLDLGINPNDMASNRGNIYQLHLNEQQLEAVKGFGGVTIEPFINRPSPKRIFPHDPEYFNWSVDNYGPITIPGRGITVKLNKSNIAIYERVISVYEDNHLQINGNDIFINGKKTDTYTFGLDYYWMMGDNRHNSEDSRFWGFVPETHVVGKPMFIWMSLRNGQLKDGIRWDRIFTTANKM